MSAAAPVVDPGGAEPADPAVAWILRAGVFCCFLGHGVLGLEQTAAWKSYFAVAGISGDQALHLMPWVGAFDIALAFAVLLAPIRGVVLYMVLWALWTSILRPLAGESAWEAVERAGNFGAPWALYLLMAGGAGLRSWFQGRFRPALDAARRRRVALVLRATTVLLLAGHGALGCLVVKPLLGHHYASIGLPGAAAEPWVGWFEIALAAAVAARPTVALLLGVVTWKLATEALNPIAGSPVWVFIEHGGSYAAPLALAVLQCRRSPAAAVAGRRAPAL